MEETCAVDKADPARLQAAEMGGKVSQLGEDGAAVGQLMPQCNGNSGVHSSSEDISEGVLSVTESAGNELVSSTDTDNDSVTIPPQDAGHPPPVAVAGSGSTDPGITCADGADSSTGDRYDSARSADVDSGPSSADYQMVSIVDVSCGIDLQDSDGATTAAGNGDAPRGIHVPSQSPVEDSSSDSPHTPGHPLPPSPTSTPSLFACDHRPTAALDPATEEERNSVTVIQVPADSPQMDSSADGMDISDVSTVSTEHRQLKRMRSGSSDYRMNDETEDYCIVDFLDKSNNDAEARLAAKRQARAEAREIRMRELERQQNEAEETADKVYDIYNSDSLSRSSVRATPPRTPSMLVAANNSYHSSRRSSEDSLEELATSARDVRVKYELKDVEEKFRKAMIANAQLDNEKAAALYQVELFKDRFEELEESHSQLQKEHKDKCRLFEHLKRATAKLQEDLEVTREQLEERDRLIQEQGLVIVGGECVTSCDDIGGDTEKRPKRALVSAQVAGLLETLGEGSLDVRLKRFAEERNELMDELRHVKLELEEEQARSRGGQKGGLRLNGPCLEDDLEDIQREANKLVGDYKFKLQKAEQENSTLQATVARLETQVVRYKSAADTAEKVEDELKVEKRKLQRELREAQSRVEELETAHTHLQRRLDKLKNAKSALLKDL